MKKDIEFPAVTGVQIAIARQKNEEADMYEWQVFLLNHNDFPLENILVTSKGYSIKQDKKDEESQKTSTIRQLITHLEAQSYVVIERIEPAVFHLCNEYWLSYYIDGKIYDKKFIFMPESIVEKNLRKIEMIELDGVLHS